jgi:hypothetical protein
MHPCLAPHHCLVTRVGEEISISLTHPCNVLRMMAIGTRTRQNAAVLAEILRLTCCAPVEKRVPCVRTYVHLENIHGPNTSQSNNNWTVFFTACFPADK